MAESDVQIVNSALIKIAENPISTFEEDSEAAIKAGVLYPLRRDALMRQYRWNFAMARAALTPDEDVPAFGFATQYSLPSDCLRIVGLYDALEPQENYTTSPTPWKVEGRKLLADADGSEPLRVFYLRRVTNVALFDPLFAEALAYDLGAELAYAISTGSGQAQLAAAKLEEAIRKARLADAIEGKTEISQANEWTGSRAPGGGLYTQSSRRFP